MIDDGSPRRGVVPDLPPNMSEAAFQSLVIDVAEFNGWTVHHQQPTKARSGKWITSGKAGFPDLTLLRPPQLVFLELKRVGGEATPKQKRWISDLQRVPGVEAYVVSPADISSVFLLLVSPPPDEAGG